MKTESIKDFVKRNRKAVKLTQEMLAQKSGVGIHFIRDIEQSKPYLRIKKVNEILFMFEAKLAPVPIEKKNRK